MKVSKTWAFWFFLASLGLIPNMLGAIAYLVKVWWFHASN